MSQGAINGSQRSDETQRPFARALARAGKSPAEPSPKLVPSALMGDDDKSELRLPFIPDIMFCARFARLGVYTYTDRQEAVPVPQFILGFCSPASHRLGCGAE
jgi:hypothetical protein